MPTVRCLRPVRLALVATAITAGVSACTIDGEATPLPVGQRSNPNKRVGTWEGTYICGQGNTALTLTVSASPAGSDLPRADVVFSFGPLPANPDVPRGSYRMTVTTDPDDSYRFNQKEWIDQPTGYTMVDLVGRLESPTELTGTVANSSCSTFTVTRTGS